MKLFQSSGLSLKAVKPIHFKLERDIQQLVEANTELLFGLTLVQSELKVENRRFDSLCFDEETNSFVIIEYKKGASYSVIDQGYTYLSLLLQNKADILLEYNETLGKQLKRDEIDWSQTRIIFVSPKFTAFQRMSVNFKNLPFELYEIEAYSDGFIGLTAITTDSDVDINSVAPVAGQDNVVSKVSKEVIRYDEDYHLFSNKTRPQWVVDLYYDLKARIMELDTSIQLKVKKQTIGFHSGPSVCDIIIFNKGVSIVINLSRGQLNDPLGLCRDMSDKGHWGNGDYKLSLYDSENLEYAISMVKQSLQDKLKQL